MRAQVRMYPSAVRRLSQAQQQAAIMTAEQMLHEKVSDNEIPFDEGTLQNVSTRVETEEARRGVVSIVHDTPYASRLYYHPEYNFQKTTNSNAKGEWWEDWLEGAKKSRPAKLFKQFYRRVTGGIVR